MNVTVRRASSSGKVTSSCVKVGGTNRIFMYCFINAVFLMRTSFFSLNKLKHFVSPLRTLLLLYKNILV